MIINILIGWNAILTLIIILILFNGGDKELRLNRMEIDIEKNKVYDIIVEDEDFTYYHCYHRDYQQRIVTVKEAITCLYRKMNFHLSYTPEKIETTSEDVSIK